MQKLIARLHHRLLKQVAQATVRHVYYSWEDACSHTDDPYPGTFYRFITESKLPFAHKGLARLVRAQDYRMLRRLIHKGLRGHASDGRTYYVVMDSCSVGIRWHVRPGTDPTAMVDA